MKNKRSIFLQKIKMLKEVGCDDYNSSIRLLYSKAFGIPFEQSYRYLLHQGSKENNTLFSDMVDRRAVGEPTSHIVSFRSFWKSDFYVDKTVLDPRPDSELIIDVTKNMLFDGMTVLDLGCGSGCVGISLYQENPNISLFLSDFSKKALSVSKKNALDLKVECKLIHSDLFENINNKFDLIVANLPYISREDFFHLQKEIILYEPHEALYGGKSGLDVIKFFLNNVGKHLNRNGIFVIEFGEGQHSLLEHELLCLKFNMFDFYRDLNGIKRLVCVKKDT